MGSFTYRLSFWAKHSHADLSTISERLKMPANSIWKEGEVRKAPNGRIRGGVHRNSFYGMKIEPEPATTLPDLMMKVLEKLEKEKDFIRQKSEEGVLFNFHVGLFMNDYSCGELFEQKILEAMADLRISLSFNIYAPDSAEDEENDDGDSNA